jgi:hypothetical protein
MRSRLRACGICAATTLTANNSDDDDDEDNDNDDNSNSNHLQSHRRHSHRRRCPHRRHRASTKPRYLAFVKAFARARDEVGKELNLWILKPSGSSQGRGIQVLNDISGVSYGQTVVLQRYVPNPLLLDGYKFDLRLCVRGGGGGGGGPFVLPFCAKGVG